MDTIVDVEHATIGTETGQVNTGVVTLLLPLVKTAIIQTVKFKLIIATMARWTIVLSAHGCVKNVITWFEGILGAFKPLDDRYILT